MRAQRSLLNLVVLAAFSLVLGCTPKQVKKTDTVPMPTPGPVGTTPTQPAPPPAPGPLHVGLVLGGAGVASFATVGLLKRLNQEGVKIDFIIATGWPALFALGQGYLKSVHDLEWFAMRLKPNEFFGSGLFDFSKDFSGHDKLASAVRQTFKSGDLRDSSVPVILTASPVNGGTVETYASGNWEAPLLKAMSVPGIYRPYEGWISSLNGVDVAEALKRRPSGIVAVDMYQDYLTFLTKHPLDGSAPLFRTLHGTQFRERLAAQMSMAPIRGKVTLGSNPNELERRREAILAGFKEGARLISEIRRTVGE
jgi:hypothetical protein